MPLLLYLRLEFIFVIYVISFSNDSFIGSIDMNHIRRLMIHLACQPVLFDTEEFSVTHKYSDTFPIKKKFMWLLNLSPFSFHPEGGRLSNLKIFWRQVQYLWIGTNIYDDNDIPLSASGVIPCIVSQFSFIRFIEWLRIS